MPATITDRLQGLTTSVAVKAPCKAVTTTAITQSGAQTIGGVACVDGDRYIYALAGGSVLNGIWIVRDGPHERALDFDGNRDVVRGTLVLTGPGTGAAQMWEVTTADPIVIGTSVITFAAHTPEELALRSELANVLSATLGPALVGFSWSLNYAANSVGWGLMTARYSILKYIPTSEWAAIFAGTSTYNATTNIYSALAAEDLITLPPGRIRGTWDLTNVRGKTIRGAGRDKTTLQNVSNAAVFTMFASASDCKFHTFEGFRVQNSDKATWTTSDGFLITGSSGLLENDFHRFVDLEVMSMRNGFRLSKRTIWSSWRDVHVYDCISDGFYVSTDDNIAVLRFDNCRFGQNGGHGFYARKNTGDPLSAWTFTNCNFEKNQLCGLFVEGTSTGIAGWVLEGCYFEENTIAVAASATSPRKANIDIRSSLCLGLHIQGCNLFGTPLSPALDWGIYISSATQNGVIGANRAGTFTLGFCNVGSNWFIAAQGGGTGTVTKGVGSYTLAELTSEVTGADTLTLTGCTTSPTGTARTVKQRNQVSIFIPSIEGTSNSTAATLTGLPVAFAPVRTQIVLARVKDNGTITAGIAQINTGGVITLFRDVGGAGFTASGTKGIANCTIVFNTD